MAKKTKKKGTKKNKEKKNNKKTTTSTEPRVSKKIQEQENRQAAWFIFWIIAIFALFLSVYFIIENNKKFEYANAEWTIEEYERLKVYHGRFTSFDGRNINYNIYLRTDPRTNEINTEGEFSAFKYGGYLSISPEVDQCRGDFSRAVVDLGAFLKTGIGIGIIEAATTDIITASEQEKIYADCNSHPDRTIIILEQGETSQVTQDENNPYCYTITTTSCQDTQTIEKFITQAINDFKNTY